MDICFSIVLLLLVLLFYLSNPHNKTNKWCSLAGMIFWLGIAKEAIMFSIIPLLHSTLSIDYMQNRFMPIYSFCTWALYSLAMPTAIIFALHFCNLDQTRPAIIRTVMEIGRAHV